MRSSGSISPTSSPSNMISKASMALCKCSSRGCLISSVTVFDFSTQYVSGVSRSNVSSLCFVNNRAQPRPVKKSHEAVYVKCGGVVRTKSFNRLSLMHHKQCVTCGSPTSDRNSKTLRLPAATREQNASSNVSTPMGDFKPATGFEGGGRVLGWGSNYLLNPNLKRALPSPQKKHSLRGGPPGFHTTARDLQTCTFEGPGLQKHHQNSTRRTRREREKKSENGRERRKQRATFSRVRRRRAKLPIIALFSTERIFFCG